MIATGGKLYERCEWCGKVVRVNKPIFGGQHFCLTDEEKAKSTIRHPPLDKRDARG